MSLSKKHYKKIAELIGKHTVKPNLKTETNVNFIAYGFVWDLAKYFIEDSKKKPEGFRFKPETFYDAINKESINADFDAINKSMIKINLDTIKENKILKSKVKTYEADILKGAYDKDNYVYRDNCHCVKCEQQRLEANRKKLRSANDLKGTTKLF